MEEQDKRTEQEDVEAHRRHNKANATEDAPKDEGESTEDFEAHRRHNKANASEDAPKDEGENDDFELHRKAHKSL
jgi:hypothetical protein